MKVILGLVVALCGLLITLLSLSTALGVGIRLAIVLAGIALSLVGIVGLINSAYVSKAIWRVR